MRFIIIIMALFLMTGCGVSEYYDGGKAVQLAQIQAWENQRNLDRQNQNTRRAKHISFTSTILREMTTAALTPSPVDDLLIANLYSQYQFSTVVMNNQESKTALASPNILKLERPNDVVDGINAITPWISVIAPWWGAYKMVDAVGAAAGNHYNVGGDMAFGSSDSFNPITIDGSYFFTDSPISETP